MSAVRNAAKRFIVLKDYRKQQDYLEVLKPHTTLGEWYQRFLYKHSEYRKYGLLYHDIINDDEHKIFVEAIRRLPPKLQAERDARINRAIQLDVTYRVIPEEEQFTFEEDQTIGRYLQPYIDEVEKEFKERDKIEAEQ